MNIRELTDLLIDVLQDRDTVIVDDRIIPNANYTFDITILDNAFIFHSRQKEELADLVINFDLFGYHQLQMIMGIFNVNQKLTSYESDCLDVVCRKTPNDP